MILVTGGAGFIGSNIVLDLARRGARVVVCDLMRAGEKWRNLAAAALDDLIRPEVLSDWLACHRRRLAAIVHMGAISSTTEADIDRVVAANIRLSLDLWEWCAQNRVRLVYASSAATYGDGAAGFADDASPQALARLAPLNAYGWSKHLVDRRIAADVAAGRPSPPQWAGLKFFNVYGVNEAHKGPMQSVASKILPVVEAGGTVTLFKSHDPRYPDGGQLRDFVYVEDCVAIVRWLLANPQVGGLFNAGSGAARSFADLVAAVGAAVGREPQVRYVDTPPEIRGKYQYFTQADMAKLRRAGFAEPLHSLEDGVRDFVRRARGRG
ncbi:MAG TPA: ADP-glyceromanno-heptose 6-epimerase [Stellaceae bacterium]|nr:ADP-glyceromanno-heptose 6-epimerase [Stellaceae bacterium]